MLVIIPIHAKNAPLFEQIAKLFEKIGPNANHDVVVLTCPTVLEEGQRFGERISRLFREVKVTVANREVSDLMRGRNQMFRQAAEIAAEKNLPWIWMEDAYPTQRRWLDMVEAEYKENAALPFLGCIEPAFERARDNDGKFIEGQFADKGQFMRFGVYPADFNFSSTLLRFLGDISFEHYLRGEIVKQARQSKVLATVWASVEFERNRSELIEGKQSPTYESSIRKNAKKTANDREVAVIHGCRDGSLGFVLLKKTFLSPDELAIEKRRKDLEKQQEEIDRLSGELRQVTEERHEFKREISQLRDLNDKLHTKVEELQSSREVPGTETQIQAYESKLAKKDEVISQYRGLIKSLEEEVKSLKKERTTLRSKLTKLEKQLEPA